MAFGISIHVGYGGDDGDESFKNAGVTPGRDDQRRLSRSRFMDQDDPDRQKGWPEGNGYFMTTGREPFHSDFC